MPSHDFADPASRFPATTASHVCQVCGLPIAIGDYPCVTRVRVHGPILKTPIFVPYFDVGLNLQVNSFADRWTAMRRQGLVDRDLPRPGELSARRDRAQERRREAER